MRLGTLFLGVLAALLGPLAALSWPQTGAGCLPAVAATCSPLRKNDPSGVRLLNAEEGISVVNTAWEQREQVSGKPDCSHLVHRIYDLAGLPYPYASSYDLYDGIESFRRVTAPRPGDLVVWRGHVGILFDAAGHTFYSSVSSGLRTENYDGPYWKEQGRPRFYRYIVRGAAVLSAGGQAPPAGNWKAPAKPALVPVSAANTDSEAGKHSDALRAPAARGTATITVASLPSSIMVVSVASRPTKEEVGEAISEFNSAAGNVLRGWPAANPARPVLVYDRLVVKGLDFKSDRGSARMDVEGILSISGERLEGKSLRQMVRWEIRRTPQGWQLLPPSSHAYVPRDVAVRVLANQLALLTEDEAASGDSARSLHQQGLIVRALGFLFAN